MTAAVVALLLATGAGGCGGDDDPGQTASVAGQASQPGDEKAGGGGSTKDGEDGAAAKPDPSASGGREFEPRQHEDSGGGSDQFRVKGGDNSVQEFGEEAAASERADAATAVHNFLDARAEGEWEAACSYLARSVTHSIEGLGAGAGEGGISCAEGLEKLTNPAAKGVLLAEARQADVGSLRVEGDSAFVLYAGLDDVPQAIPVTREDDGWKVASLTGTPLS